MEGQADAPHDRHQVGPVETIAVEKIEGPQEAVHDDEYRQVPEEAHILLGPVRRPLFGGPGVSIAHRYLLAESHLRG